MLLQFRGIGYVAFSKDVIKEILLIDMVNNSSKFSNSSLDRIIEFLLGRSLGSGISKIYEEVLRGSLMANSWSLAAAVIKSRAYFRGNSGNVDYIVLALRCKTCRRRNGEHEEQGGQAIPGVYGIYKLCAAHIDKLDGAVLLEGCMVTQKALWFMKGSVSSAN
jgi:hypothetical protein